MNLRFLPVLPILWFLLTGVLRPAAFCAEEKPQPSRREVAEPIRFRRVFAPADRLPDWPRGDSRYLPIEPAEFERLLETARSGTPGSRTLTAGRGIRAEYRAHLQDDLLLAGRATLQVVHSAEAPVLLPLDPCGLAIDTASWADVEQTGEGPREATLGLGEDGKLKVLVQRSGRLEFDWSLLGSRDASGAVSFDFGLPVCPTNRLILDLPENLIASTENGIVLEGTSAEESVRRWEIDLGRHHSFRLRVTPKSAAGQQPRLAGARQSMVYDFSLRGVDVTARFNIEAAGEPVRQVSLALDRELQVVSAHYGDVPVDWSVTSPNGTRYKQVLVILPEPIHGTGRVLRLGALAPLKADRRWRLPNIYLRDVFWQEGSRTLWISAPLSLQDVLPSGCQQSGTGELSAPRVGESVEFRCFSPDATLEIELSRRNAPVEVTSCTAVELGASEMTAEVRSAFRMADASRFSLEADVSRHWLIDSVSSHPPETMHDWLIEGPSNAKRRLTVRLAKALSPSSPVQLTITAQRLHVPRGEGPGVGVDDLVPLRFDASQNSERLVAVDAVDPNQLKLTGTEQLKRVSRYSLDAAELELFAKPPDNLLFQNDSDAAALRIALETQQPSYEGKLRVEASVEEGVLQESYVLGCVPKSARVDSVLVHFSQRREVHPTFTLGGEDQRQLSANLLSIEEQTAAGLAPEGETWELTLRRPRSQPFEIRGVRETELGRQQAISLAWLPEAAGQQATLVIRSPGPEIVRITNHRLQRLPAEVVPPDRRQTALATYRYDPSRDVATSPQAAVIVSTSRDPAVVASWGWDCHLESWYGSNGTGEHLAVFRLQSPKGQCARLKLRPPAGLQDVRGVWVDEKRVRWQRVEDGLAIDLPQREKFPTISLCFTTPQARLGITGRLEPPFPVPQGNLPILSRHWTVWMPPDYEAFGADSLKTLGQQEICALPQLSWSQRLFGPLGRVPGGAAFDPLSAEHWSAILSLVSGRSRRQPAKRKAEQLLQTLGALAAGSAAGPESGSLNWGGLLAHQSVESLQLTLLMDWHAMERLALRPQTPVQPGVGDSPSSRGVDLLQKAELSLLVHPDAFVLTSQANAAALHNHLAPPEHRILRWVLPGPLAEQLQETAAGTPGQALIPIETWRRQLPEPKALWTRPILTGREPVDTHGWTAYRLEDSGTSAMRLEFVHRQTIKLLGWATFLLLIALGRWKFSDQAVLLIALVGVFGFAALVIPAVYVPITSGAVLATLFCLVRRLIRRRSRPRPPDNSPPTPEPPSTVSAPVKLGVTLLVVAALGVGSAVADGQDTGRTPSTAASPTHRVFIPVDDDEQPTGDKYYAPETLYQQLHRRAAAAAVQPQGWLIRAATYRGVLSRQGSSGRLMVDKLKAIFDVQVFGLIARIRIPFLGKEAILAPDGVLLDGRVIQPEWEPEDGVLALEVPEPGRYRLELYLRPAMPSGIPPAGFELTIPPLATSRLELTVPPDAPAIEVPSAHGSVHFEDEPPRLVAELGPSTRLAVQWPAGAGERGAPSAIDVEELFWLKVQPGAVIVDARFKFKIIEGQVSQLQLATDPRLELLPLQGDDPPVIEQHAAPGKPQVITLHWDEPVSESVVVDATFKLRDTSGVGNLRLPELRALHAGSTRRWMAVSVDTELVHQLPQSDRLEAVAIPDFIASWGQADPQPMFAYRLSGEETGWSMHTELRQSHVTVDQKLTLSFDWKTIDLRFDAELMPAAGYIFQHRLQVPPDLQVDRVSVREEGVERAARWCQDKKGGVTVFLSGLMTGRQELSLHGRLAISDKQRRMPLPVVEIVQGTLQSSEVHLFRKPAVLLDLGQSRGLIEIEDPSTDPPDPELGRLVARFRAAGSEPIDATLTLLPNRPRVRAEQLTQLLCRGESWEAVVECRVHVTEGVVDQIHIDAPTPFDGPYRIVADPPATLETVDASEGPRQLIVRPVKEIDGEYRFSLFSPLQGDRPTAPHVVLRQVDDVLQFLALPSQRQDQPISWDTRGLKEAELPDGLVAAPQPEPLTTYKVAGEPWQATFRTLDDERDTARVHLADVHIAWRDDGTCYGVTTFDVKPGNSPDCRLRLPSGYRTIGVSVAGVPIVPVSISDNVWRLPLGPERLPQRIEVVFTGILSRGPRAGGRSSTSPRLESPVLEQIPTEQTLWTVVGPSHFKAGEPQDIGSISPWSQELIRLKNTAEMIRLASKVSLDLEDRDSTFRWYWRWARRLAAARTEFRRQVARGVALSRTRTARSEVRQIDQQQSRISQELGMVTVFEQLSAAEPAADDPSELWRRSQDNPQTATRCCLPGAVGSLALTYRPAGVSRLRGGLMSATCLTALIALIVLGLRRGVLAESFKRWPSAVGVIVGLAWWLWLSPSILGWGIVLVSLASAVLSGWKRPRSPQGSTIIALRSVQR